MLVRAHLRRRKRTRCFQLPAAIATAMTVVLLILLAFVFFYRSATHSPTANAVTVFERPTVGTPELRRNYPVSALRELAYLETNPYLRDMPVSGQVDPASLLEVATSEGRSDMLGGPPLQPDTLSIFSSSSIALLIWPDEPVSGGNDTPGWVGPGNGGGGMGIPGRTGAGNSGTGGAGALGPAGAGNNGTGSRGSPGPAGAGNNGTGSNGAPGLVRAGNN